jgi:hypothetical protein
MTIPDFYQVNRKGASNQGSFYFPPGPNVLASIELGRMGIKTLEWEAVASPFFLDKMHESDIKKMNFFAEIKSFR